MQTTKDGRKVNGVYTGNVVEYFVDETPNARFAKKVYVDRNADPAHMAACEKAIALNDGTVPLKADPYWIGHTTIDLSAVEG